MSFEKFTSLATSRPVIDHISKHSGVVKLIHKINNHKVIEWSRIAAMNIECFSKKDNAFISWYDCLFNQESSCSLKKWETRVLFFWFKHALAK